MYKLIKCVGVGAYDVSDNKLAAKYAATLGSWDGKGEALFALQQHDKLVKGDRDALQRAFLRVEMGDKTVRLRVFLWANDVDRTPRGETVKGSNGLYCVYGGKTPGTLWHAPRSCKALCDPCKRLEPDQCESRPAELLEWGQPRQIVRAFEGGEPQFYVPLPGQDTKQAVELTRQQDQPKMVTIPRKH